MFSDEAFAVLAYPALALVVAARWRVARCGWPDALAWALFGAYVVEVMRVALFPIPIDGLSAAPQGTSASFWTGIVLNPLDGLTSRSQFGHNLRNVALGLPLGFGLWFVAPSIRLRTVLLVGLVAAVGLELLQLLLGTAVGFLYRVVDVGDVVLNTLGWQWARASTSDSPSSTVVRSHGRTRRRGRCGRSSMRVLVVGTRMPHRWTEARRIARVGCHSSSEDAGGRA